VDLVIAGAVLAMSTVFFVLAGDFPRIAADPGGLALFPRAVAAITGAASAVLMLQIALRRLRAPRPVVGGGAFDPAAHVGAFLRANGFALVTFLLVVLFPFAISAFGFVAAVALFSTLVLAASRLPPFVVAATAVLTTVGIYVAYALVLGAILPSGYLFQ
jgi:putative tricarboxylic transport membrane protein